LTISKMRIKLMLQVTIRRLYSGSSMQTTWNQVNRSEKQQENA
jgi:hypothetical protein